jgi:hypothetical protein
MKWRRDAVTSFREGEEAMVVLRMPETGTSHLSNVAFKISFATESIRFGRLGFRRKVGVAVHAQPLIDGYSNTSSCRALNVEDDSRASTDPLYSP